MGVCRDNRANCSGQYSYSKCDLDPVHDIDRFLICRVPRARKSVFKIWLVSCESWSVRFVRFLYHPCVCRDPIRFPSLASIV